MKIVCPQCGVEADKAAGAVNRARAKGAPVYCGRECAGLGRRHDTRTADQKRADKAEYDRRYREQLGEALLVKKRDAYHAAVAADPEAMRAKERKQRQRRAQDHVEYCRRPEYRKWKKAYDAQHRARKYYGAFGEAALILHQLEAEIFGRSSRYEISLANGLLNKRNNRRRDYDRQA